MVGRWFWGVAALMVALAACGEDKDEAASANSGNNAAQDAGDNNGDQDAADAAPDAEPDAPDNSANNSVRPPSGAYIEAKESEVGQELSIQGLRYPVHVTIDNQGIPHILAESLEDAIFVQGYLHARDRLPQMELFRRRTSGTLAELAGGLDDSIVGDDIFQRVVGFRRMAQDIYDTLEPGGTSIRALDAYSAGVNAYIAKVRGGEASVPAATQALVVPSALQDWTPLDSLVLVRYQQYDLGFDAYSDLYYTQSREIIERTFPPTSENPQLARRAGMYHDLFRQAPADKTYQVPGFGAESKPGAGRAPSSSKAASLGGAWRAPSKPALDAAISFFEHPKSGPGLELFARGGASNSWAVSGSMTQSGNAMLANDPHLSLASPALFYQTHLVVEPATDADGPRVNAMGAIFPGLPGLLIGHNDKVAWALTTAGYDYTDVYAEELVWTEGEEFPKVRHNGQEVALEVIEEEIGVGLFGNVTERVTVKIPIVPHHGPLLPNIEGKALKMPEGDEALSFAWTGYDPSDEIGAVLGFMTAQDMGQVKQALNSWKVGTQNLIFVDVEGNVFTTGASEIPLRPEAARSWDREDNLGGWAPWWVLKGTGEHDWEGRLSRDLVPQAENPSAGFVVTANNDQAGVTDDNDPLNDYAYLGYDFDLGFRAGRIERRLTNATGERPEGQKLTLEDLGAIQTDNYSNLGARVAPHMVSFLERAMAELDTPGTHPNLTGPLNAELTEGVPQLNGLPMRARLEVLRDLLEGWSFEAEGRAPEALDEAGRLDSGATSLFNFWFVTLIRELIDDEWTTAEGLRLSDQTTTKGVLMLLESPTESATYDAQKGDSALWDDLRTGDVEEDRDAIFLRSLRMAEERLLGTFARSSPDVWVWGLVHHRTFNSIIPDIAGGVSPLSLPQPVNGTVTPYPRGGDNFTVDACNGGVFDYSFGCGGGAIMRFLVELDPEGVRSYNAQPGGQVWDNNSPHFKDLLDIWLANERYELAFHPDDVAAQIESHLLFKP